MAKIIRRAIPPCPVANTRLTEGWRRPTRPTPLDSLSVLSWLLIRTTWLWRHKNILMYFYSWSSLLVVTRAWLGYESALVVICGHSWSFVVTRGHSWLLVCTFKNNRAGSTKKVHRTYTRGGLNSSDWSTVKEHLKRCFTSKTVYNATVSHIFARFVKWVC